MVAGTLGKTSVPIWPGEGRFGLRAVGVKHCREAIARLAKHDSTRVHFESVLLLPCDCNSEDQNAVAIFSVESQARLGHLPREFASAYRNRMAELDLDGPSMCSAAISGGWVVEANAYAYSLELDFALTDAPASNIDHVERASKPLCTRLPDEQSGSKVFLTWLRQPATDLHPSMRIKSWSKPEWGSVNYYVEPRQGGGYGIKLLEVKQALHDEWFHGRVVEADLFDFSGRWAKVYLDAVETSAHAIRWDRMGGHFTREFLMLQEKLSAIYWAMRSTSEPDRKLSMAMDGQRIQYELEELGAITGPHGRTIKEQAGVRWDLISQAYIGTIVRGFLDAGRFDDAQMAFEKFVNKGPQHRQSKSVVALAKRIEATLC